eukprot:6193670-Pleurochrysis_carterae.AAC.2
MELTKVAAEAAGETINENNKARGEEDEYNRREEKVLNRNEGSRERRRHQVFMWTRHLYQAQRYTGGKGKTGGSGDKKR